MRNCSKCGKALADNEIFCTYCGTDSRIRPETLAQEEARQEAEFCASYKRIYRIEAKLLKIFGIVYLVLTLLLAAGTFVLMSNSEITLPPELVELITDGDKTADVSVYLFSGVISYCVISAVNTVCAKRAEARIEAMDKDIRPAVMHYSSFISTFLYIMSNPVAFVFFIINFFKTRTNAPVIARVIAKQVKGRE